MSQLAEDEKQKIEALGEANLENDDAVNEDAIKDAAATAAAELVAA